MNNHNKVTKTDMIWWKRWYNELFYYKFFQNRGIKLKMNNSEDNLFKYPDKSDKKILK